MKWPIRELLEGAENFPFDISTVCPTANNIFKVFNDTQVEDIRVIMVGQDPYPQPGVAIGRAFAVEKDKPLQPSMKIMMDELATQYYHDIALNDSLLDSTLQHWQDQGVLLINASLTCNNFRPENEEQLFIKGTHSYYWRVNLMEKLFVWMNANMETTIFVFLGNKAKFYSQFISETKHHIITVPHPAADIHTGKNIFRGSKMFNKINDIITQINGKEFRINWLLGYTSESFCDTSA